MSQKLRSRDPPQGPIHYTREAEKSHYIVIPEKVDINTPSSTPSVSDVKPKLQDRVWKFKLPNISSMKIKRGKSPRRWWDSEDDEELWW